jgi:serine/threonine protein kinase
MKACPNCHASYPVNYTHCPRDGSVLIEAHSWQEGTTVRGKYRILSKLGEGGMAVVYKAVHIRFEEMRALKVMNAELACDHGFVKRFMQEAILTRKIQHPNAVRVEDIDEAEDGRPFMVMEFLEGRGLKDMIGAEAPMHPARVSTVARQIAAALNAAHSLGVVHRDVKPANIVLIGQSPQSGFAAGEEQAKVLDFGIAKAKEARLDESLQGHATLTRTGSVIGTPTYMSPEQARGMRGADLDGRSDLYSLGIVMYQMLAGGLPFKADTSMEWILAHLQTPPTPFNKFRSDLRIPPALADLVMRCLEKDPSRRPPTAAALIQELELAESTMADAYARPMFSSGTGRTWAEPAGLPAARSSSSPEGLPASSKPREAGALGDSASKPSRSWIGWTVGALAFLLVALAIVVWRMQRSVWTKTGTANVAALNQSPAAAPPAKGQPSAPDGSAVPAIQAASEQAPSASALAGAQSVAEPHATHTGVGVLSTGQQRAAATKPPGFAAALLRARNDESQGRFEDALREYEQASALDPSDTSVKRHIALLRQHISKENDLIR